MNINLCPEQHARYQQLRAEHGDAIATAYIEGVHDERVRIKRDGVALDPGVNGILRPVRH
jgi:hypothetical protein